MDSTGIIIATINAVQEHTVAVIASISSLLAVVIPLLLKFRKGKK